MNIAELQKLSEQTRSAREAGITLLVASVLLAAFLFIPSAPREAPSEAVRIAQSSADAFTAVPLEAKAAVVYDLSTGETLYSYNAEVQLPLASLTKLLTVYAALLELSPETLVTVPREAILVEGAHTFREGQMFSLFDLARLTLTGSLNDGAAAIASASAARRGISEREMLAGAAASLGLSQTYALNGSGLDVSTAVSGGYGSARDLARLAGALVSLAPSIAAATTQASAEAKSAGDTAFTIKNTDPMIGNVPGLLLSKTGYTDLAGGNLALVFNVAPLHPVAVVVLGSSYKARFTDGMALMAAAFAHFAGVPSL